MYLNKDITNNNEFCLLLLFVALDLSSHKFKSTNITGVPAHTGMHTSMVFRAVLLYGDPQLSKVRAAARSSATFP